MCVGLVCGSFWWLEEEHREGYKEWRGDAQEKTKLIFRFKTANEPNHTKKEISIASKLSGAKKEKKGAFTKIIYSYGFSKIINAKKNSYTEKQQTYMPVPVFLLPEHSELYLYLVLLWLPPNL